MEDISKTEDEIGDLERDIDETPDNADVLKRRQDKLKDLESNLKDLSDRKRELENYFQSLKETGYVSLKREGDIAVFGENPDDPNDIIYNQASNQVDAGRLARQFKQEGYTNVQVYPVKKIPYSIGAKLTPSEFENIIYQSKVDPALPEIQRIREQIYSRYRAKSYELKREYIKGYRRTPDNLTRTILRQMEVVSGTHYQTVGRAEAMKALTESGIEKGDQRLHNFTSKFIDAETKPLQKSLAARTASKGRQALYFFTLAGDVGQFVLNAVGQPINITYAYFSTKEHGLKGVEPEQYFVRGARLAAKALTGREEGEFKLLFDRAKREKVVTAEFAKAMAEAEIGKTGKLAHYGSIFHQAGEKVTRTHTLAEAYLIGTEKLHLRGERLYKYMVDAVDATQGRFRRGEAPGVVRATGEIGRAAYQFQSYVQLWVENFIHALKSDIQGRRLVSSPRQLAALALLGGLLGMPLAGLARLIWQKLFGEDPKEKVEEYLNDKPLLRDLALYGVSGNPSISSRVGFMNRVPSDRGFDPLNYVPLYSTGEQLFRGAENIAKGNYLRGAEAFTPRSLRGIPKLIRFNEEGVRTAGGKVIVPKEELSGGEKAGVLFNIQPRKLSEYYDKQAMQDKTGTGGGKKWNFEGIGRKPGL